MALIGQDPAFWTVKSTTLSLFILQLKVFKQQLEESLVSVRQRNCRYFLNIKPSQNFTKSFP